MRHGLPKDAIAKNRQFALSMSQWCAGQSILPLRCLAALSALPQWGRAAWLLFGALGGTGGAVAATTGAGC